MTDSKDLAKQWANDSGVEFQEIKEAPVVGPAKKREPDPPPPTKKEIRNRRIERGWQHIWFCKKGSEYFREQYPEWEEINSDEQLLKIMERNKKMIEAKAAADEERRKESIRLNSAKDEMNKINNRGFLP